MSKIYKNGDTGPEIKKIQQKLGITNDDGIFGNGTEKKVKEFQEKNGLKPDGVVGSTTWGKLFESVVKPPTLITEPKPAPSIGGLKLEKLKGHIPDSVIAQIPNTAEKFELNTPLRLAHFLSQCSHESGNFTVTGENLNYSSDGLKRVFGKYFPGNLSEIYARKPEKIASRVYGGRMGNGDESTREGYKFRGRGYIQLTGKDNYKAFGKSINEDLTVNPDVVATKYPLLSAAWFFHKNGLHKIADKGSSDSVVTEVTKRVNGGTNGLSDRLKHFKEYYTLLS